MSTSIGASYAAVHVMTKKQKEKMKRMEEERVVKSSTDDQVAPNSNGSKIAKNKVHPGNFNPEKSVQRSQADD
ncbi:hypothetical protein Patl1_27378 [Pistacia atlantica]|uniref:Uncharacterized protein n=1 Tax=Pistacia atlantica TaxID=434234 RepID=A0ACC1BD17_9ROSI|nr:hypothetical protein Patl1_27378 [Pistacia atlantica]